VKNFFILEKTKKQSLIKTEDQNHCVFLHMILTDKNSGSPVEDDIVTVSAKVSSTVYLPVLINTLVRELTEKALDIRQPCNKQDSAVSAMTGK